MTNPTDTTTSLWKDLSGKFAQPVSATLTLSPKRITITGSGTTQWDVQYPAGTSMRTNCNSPWGYNFGEFDYYSITEIPTVIAKMQAQNVTLVRLVGFFRWSGAPSKGDADSRTQYDNAGSGGSGSNKLGYCDTFDHWMHPATWNKLKAYAQALSNAGIWFIIVGEGDICQSGTQSTAWDGTSFHPDQVTPVDAVYDRALSLPEASIDPIPGGKADWGLAGGMNIFTSPTLFAKFRERLKMAAREFRNYDYLYAYEPISEPLPKSGTISTALNGRTLGAGSNFYIYPGTNNDGVYDNKWSFRVGNPNAVPYQGSSGVGPGTGILSIEEVYRYTIADIMAIDPNTPFIVGGRGGYNPSPEGLEIVAALSDSTGLGGNLVAQNKIMVTWDRLGSGTAQPSKTPAQTLTMQAAKVPLFMNQLGARQTDDPSDYALGVAVRSYKQAGTSGTIWEFRANTSNGYGSEFHNAGTGDGNGAGGTYTVITARTNDLATYFGETLSALESAAITAATTENAALFYVKPDFSNVVKTGSFPYTLTSISAVVDPLATGMIWTSNGGITIDYAQNDGSNHSYLPDARPVLNIPTQSGSNYLIGSITYFGSTAISGTFTGNENMAIIFACTPLNQTGTTLASWGNVGTSDKYPQLQINNSGFIQAQVKGNGVGAVLSSANQTAVNSSSLVPIVATLIKSGTAPNTAIKLWTNGIDDSATGTAGANQVTAGTLNTLTGQTVNADGSALNRIRIAATANTGDFTGTIAGWCLFRQAPSDANAHIIGRFLAALQDGGYKL